MKMYLIVTCLLLLSACASVSREDCGKLDWQRVGKIDGAEGLEAGQVDEHERMCGATVDKAAYESGRQEGLQTYCTPPGGFMAGEKGKAYHGVCSENEAEFLEQYKKGQNLFRLRVEHRAAEQRLSEAREKIEKDKSVVGDVQKVFSLLSGVSQTESEENRVEKLSDEIYKAEKTSPTGVSVNSQRFPFGNEEFQIVRTAAAFGMGFVVGFGSGHAIQGTYSYNGWKWTAIDATLLSSLVVAAHNCPSDPMRGVKCSNDGISFLAVGFVVSRLWQVVEILGNAYRPTERYKDAVVSVVSIKGAPGVGALWSW